VDWISFPRSLKGHGEFSGWPPAFLGGFEGEGQKKFFSQGGRGGEGAFFFLDGGGKNGERGAPNFWGGGGRGRADFFFPRRFEILGDYGGAGKVPLGGRVRKFFFLGVWGTKKGKGVLNFLLGEGGFFFWG